MLKYTKKIITNGIGFVMRAIPIIVPVLLIIHTNSTASIANGQPIPPSSLRKYRKF